MFLSLRELCGKYTMKVDGILHVGAHLAEEHDEYKALGITNVIWIEANADNIIRIQEKVTPQLVLQALITDTFGEKIPFHITNYDSMSSSIFEFGTHPTFSPDTVFVEERELKTSTIDYWLQMFPRNFAGINMLNLDLQGAELLALEGATKFLEQVDYVYCEVNTKEVYLGCAKVWELDLLLDEFDRVETYMVGDQGWGDALYVRRH